MRRTTILVSIATLLLAMPTPKNSGANAISQYKQTSYRDGGVVLRMSAENGSVLSPGEDIAFTYQTSEDAYVILFNIDTEGYVNLIAPVDGRLTAASARRTYRVPEGSDRLVVSGETGMEFVFALSVPDPSIVDAEELAYLSDVEGMPRADRYRIDGDPFLAANIIAGELVRGVTHRQGVFLDYGYFYVNQRVDHPCYLCGECDGMEAAADCADYQIVANVDRATPLTYPLRRAFEMVDRGDAGDLDAVYSDDRATDERVHVTFYPYSVEARYVTRPEAYYYDSWYWDDPFWYDPWSCGWVYYPTWRYPYYRNYWGWSFGWGSWGGYYCSSWYYPRYDRWHDYYHDNYYTYRSVDYKSAYKTRSQTLYKAPTSSLVSTRAEAVKRNDGLRIGRTTTGARATNSYERDRTSVKSRDTAWRRETKPTRVYAPRSGREITAYRGDDRSPTKGYIRADTRTRATTGNRGGTTYRPTVRGKTGSSSVDRGRTTDRSKPSGAYRGSTRGSSGSSKSSGSAVKRSSGNSKSSAKSSSGKTSGGSSRSTSKSKKK
jgi:hypothetical protein